MQQNPNLFAGLGPFAGLAQAGSQLATRGIQGLFGIKDPELERNRILSQVDYNDPASLRAAAQALMAQGDIDKGSSLATTARELEKQQTATDLTTRETEASIALKEAQTATEQAKLSTEGLVKDVQSAEILPDGTIITLFKNGTKKVLDNLGNEVTGDAALAAIKDAQKYGVGLKKEAVENRLILNQTYLPQIEGAKKSTELAATEARATFQSLAKTRTNIQNLKDASAALDKGALTGPILDKFPNLRESTIELNNIKNQLGIDVIGSVTFGALSEGELNLALQTAIPSLPNKELKVWLDKKIQAQEKLANYLDRQVRYLSRGDKTLGDWLTHAETIYGKPGGGSAGQGGASAGGSKSKIKIIERVPVQ